MALSKEEIVALLERDTPGSSRRVPKDFDKAALFLLDLQFDNLFEPSIANELPHMHFRCKGCSAIVMRLDRKEHHSKHKRETRW